MTFSGKCLSLGLYWLGYFVSSCEESLPEIAHHNAQVLQSAVTFCNYEEDMIYLPTN